MMKSKTLLLSLISLLTIISFGPSVSFGGTCDSYRLDKNGMPGEVLKVKSQGDSGLCYAFSAAYLIDYMKLRNGENIRYESSPLAISVDYKRSGLLGGLFRGRSLDGGFTCKAISATSSTIPREVGASIFKNRKFKNFTRDGKSIFKKYKKGNLAREEFSIFLGQYFPSSGSIELVSGLRTYKRFIQYVIKSTVRSEISEDLSRVSCSTSKVRKKTDFETEIGAEFSKGKAIGIEYCSRVLYAKSNEVKKCLPHASVLIGQREKNGVCQVLIQNSWGESCSSYGWDCEKGKIWVDRKSLKKEMLSIVKVSNN